MLTLAISFGIAVAVAMAEFLAVSPGGLVTPGYVALVLDRPAEFFGLVIVTAATFMTMRLLAPMLMLFGARRFGVTLLVGLAFGLAGEASRPWLSTRFVEWSLLGLVVPGLIAHQCERQGILITVAATLAAAGVVRLALFVVARGTFSWISA